jgi:xanthine dehydrogenase YagR molybdenum-binding subunit
LTHEGWEISSRPDNYAVAGTDATTRLYACANVASKVSIVHADRNTPGFMRSPPELPYVFGLESAMDELAVALKMDPIELRRLNDTQVEPIKGLRYTSRALMSCFDAGAERFGWSTRSPAPRSMSDGDWLIGWGCASSLDPTQIAPATARVMLRADGHRPFKENLTKCWRLQSHQFGVAKQLASVRNNLTCPGQRKQR